MSPLLYGACAAAYGLLAALILVQSRRSRTGWRLSACCAVTAVWAATWAAAGATLGAGTSDPRVAPAAAELRGLAGGLDLLRAACWYGFILHLYRRSVPGGGQAGRAFRTMGLVALLVTAVAFLPGTGAAGQSVSLWSFGIAARLGIALCQLLLIENLYLNTPADARWHVALPCVSLGVLAGFDVVLCADAVLFRQVSVLWFDARAVATALVAPLLAVASARDRRWDIAIHVSRGAVFHTATLVLSGVFVLGLAATGEVLRQFGADWGGVAEISLVFAGVTLVGLLLTSGSARSRVRALVVDPFFTHRYDYRREWLRCITTLSDASAGTALHTRAIRAVVDVVDSPGGTLFLRDPGESAFQWAGSWNMPAAPAPVPGDHPLIALFRGGECAVEAGKVGPAAEVGAGRFWLAVPLAHRGRVCGFILAAPPRAGFRLDREVFDLLRIVGREVATYVAEQRATQVMVQTRQLHDYAKRFAFVAHDIKNVSSQLSLLLANAEEHLSNPEFQQDMLGTVRASVQKIGHLLKRLEAPDADTAPAALAPLPRLEAIVATYRRLRPVELSLEHDGSTATVAMSAEAFDTVVTHLLNNAVEASAAEASSRAPVRLRVRHEARRVVVSITDGGPGMTAEFIRDQLFRPFRTSKREGMGIGAFQARELLREAGGDLLVDSRPGAGTTVHLVFARADAPAGALTPA